MDTPDISVSLIAYNNHILARMIEKGLVVTRDKTPSIAYLLAVMGYVPGSRNAAEEREIRDLIGLKTLPVETDGNWKPLALKLAEALGATPDALFPGDLKRRLPATHSTILLCDVGQPVVWHVMPR